MNPVPARYPLSLRLAGRLVVVVGGGSPAADAAAASEAAALRAAGATVRVPAGPYRAEALEGAWLAVACAADPAVNAAVQADAERVRLWCVTPDDRPGREAAAEAPAGGPPADRVLVLGGARSGKSTTAERFLAAWAGNGGDVEYVATGTPPGPDDPEWAARVAAHRARRPDGWRTHETIDLEPVLAAGQAPVLVDCLSLWLARVMDECGAWDDHRGAADAVGTRVDRLLAAWRATSRPVVAVSNEVGLGVVPATASGRLYRDALGRLNALIAADSDQVWFCTAGLPRRLR